MSQPATVVVSATPLVIDLKEEIMAVIRPYAQSQNEPPFSAGELSVMAWVCCKNASDIVTEEQIFEWIVRCFGYYTEIAKRNGTKPGAYNGGLSLKLGLRPLLKSLFAMTSVEGGPLYRVCDWEFSFNYERKHQAFASTQAGARSYLRRALGSELQHFTRFLDLPPEIRMMIYAEVFAHEEPLRFLNPNLNRRNPRKARRLLELEEYVSRDMTENTAVADGNWDIREIQYEVVGPSRNILSLLSTNHQVFREAMPVFYSVNTFDVVDIWSLVRMLRLCGERRRAHFAHIRFYHHHQVKNATAKIAANLLAQVHLQHLTVLSHDNGMPLGDALKENWSILLRGVGLRILEFSNHYPLLETFVRTKQSEWQGSNDDSTTSSSKQAKLPRKASRSS